MAVSRKDIRDEEIIRFLRFSIAESAAGTYTEQSYDTQLSIDRGLIWLIHWVEISISGRMIDDPAAAGFENIQVQIARESQASIVGLSDPDVIAHYCKEKDRSAAIGTDAGPVVIFDEYPKVYTYPIALPYAAQEIHVSVQSSSAVAQTAEGRIAYTLRRVSDKFFYRVAQALIS